MTDVSRPQGPLPASLDVPVVGDTPIDVHPGVVLVYGGYTVLVTRHDGCFEGAGREGLYDFDTRVLARHILRLNGESPAYVSDGTPLHDRWIGHMRIPLKGGTAEGPRLPEDAIEIVLTRRVGHGMVEHLQATNHSMAPYEGTLSIELGADFADVQEVTSARPRQPGEVETAWDGGARAITFDYRASHDGSRIHRALRIVVVRADTAPVCSGTTLAFDLRLTPRDSWSAALRFESLVDGVWRIPPPVLDRDGNWIDTERDHLRDQWRRRRAHLDAHHHLISPVFERAADDLFALRNWELDVASDAWVPHAGVPTYSGLFGRDILTAGWQALLVGPQICKGAVELIARTQGERDEPWRDEEPGKMIHEIRRGPLSELNLIPHRAYYGTQTTSAMFVFALSEYWHWTGDTEWLRRYRSAALRCFEWARRFGDRDGDGFLEYTTRSASGLKNQGWKDSDESIRYPDGRLVPNPIATVEEQAFYCLALERMAEILVVLDEEEEAARFVEEARAFRQRWHAAFWMEDERFYAMALDPEKRQVRSIGSNPGHALATGIVPRGHAREVADRLLAPDLFSGWGIRTLSRDHPSYNPYGYHLGPVWPVENATFVLGFKRYGLEEHVERLVSALLAAASSFSGFRLPEALGGHQRRAGALPTVYPDSNSPQAWSASATIQLIQILLGVYPFAPARLLALVRPQLPAWLDMLTLRHVRVGDAMVSLRFERDSKGSVGFEVLEREGSLYVFEVPPPDDLSGAAADWRTRVSRWVLQHAPGTTARAARLALGYLGDSESE